MDSVLSFRKFLDDFLNVLNVWKLGEGVAKNQNMKLIFGRQIPDSPPPQQGASDLISGLLSVCLSALI